MKKVSKIMFLEFISFSKLLSSNAAKTNQKKKRLPK